VSAPPASPPVRARLLIVEPNLDLAESLQLLLEGNGYAVRLAPDAHTAIELATAEECDAAFIAIGLPDVDGYTLAARLRALGRPRVLIALTGYGSSADRQRALAAGFDEHLSKPADVEQLESVLTRLLARDGG
jgi:CheY-like chemotaxis protein